MSVDDIRIADAEHHYYEPDDCFSRHIEADLLVENASGERHGDPTDCVDDALERTEVDLDVVVDVDAEVVVEGL